MSPHSQYRSDKFVSGSFAPPELFARLTDLRVMAPELIQERARTRKRRAKVTRDGRMTILACDHPARHVTRVGDSPLAMGDRHDYLGRILRVLTHPEIDGVMATPDIVDDLLLVDHLMLEAGKESFLDEKLIIGCLNRGGLAGAVFELDDRMTAYTPEALAAMHFDGAKLMFRLDLASRDALQAIQYCAEAINECNSEGLPVFLEALPVTKVETGFKVQRTADEFIKIIGVAAALGDSSAHTWLKIPYVPGFEQVAKATTLPILLLGGESTGDISGFLAEMSAGLAAPNVRGALVGRNVLYPGKEDPLAAALAVNRVVRTGCGKEAALDYMDRVRGANFDLLGGLA